MPPAAGPAAASAPGPDEDPILGVVAEIVGKLEHFEAQPGAVLTCRDLLAMVGPNSYALALLIFALLNLLPAPPGYNFFMALIIIAISVTMLLGRQIRLSGFLERARLPLGLVMKLMGLLSMLTGWVAKVSSPRLRPFTGAGAARGVAVVGIILGAFMLVPIPATNMIPSIGLATIGVGLLNHDGLLVIIGTIVGFLGLFLLVIAIWLIVWLGFAIDEAVVGHAAPPVPAPPGMK